MSALNEYCGPAATCGESDTLQVKICGSNPTTHGTSRMKIFLSALVLAVALATGLGAPSEAPATAESEAYVQPGLEASAATNPDALFNVIIEGDGLSSSAQVAGEVRDEVATDDLSSTGLRRVFASIDGVAAKVTGEQLLELAADPTIGAITKDVPVLPSDYSNDQRWPYVAGVNKFWKLASGSGGSDSGLQAPTIAIVDSGIDTTLPSFGDGSRVLERQTITRLTPNNGLDGRGHGSFVASIAAGQAGRYAGAAPTARLVDLDVINDEGVGLTSDVIAACDWIYRNKEARNIRVANFSLHSSQRSTARFDPLDKAVEKLWFSGIVVVAAAGNYGTQETGVLYAPANDPFVITVGAQDIDGSKTTTDDFAAPWSAYGYTLDGFAKPEISAPGRYMVGAVPANSTLALERPDRLREPGYLQMSGTSFAAPVVSGVAAGLLAVHPEWTPDQVKGALMLTAKRVPLAVGNSSGVGEVDFAGAVAVNGTPPDPNLALNKFVIADPADPSVRIFDDATWTSAATSDPTWDAATWTSATWTSATWTSATWTSATWTSASWTSATWTSATWTSATWTSQAGTAATWTSSSDATWTSNAESESNATGGEFITPAELAEAEAELGTVEAVPVLPPPPPPPLGL